MAYNNVFPVSYQQMYYPQQPQPVAAQAQNNGIIWVQGEAGAKSYLVAPNNTVQLWDSESQTIYLKSADASGMPSMKILDYKIRNVEQTQLNNRVDSGSSYATIDELNNIRSELNKMKDDLARLKEVDHDAV